MADKIDYEQKCKQLDILINLLEGDNKRLREQKNSVTDSDTISRQAAIETVMECYDNDELFEVYEDKLRELPPAFATDINVGDKDTISRKAAIDAVNCVMIMKGIRSGKSVAAEAVESAKGIIVANIRQLPSIPPKRIRGRWTRDNACSECGCQPWFSGDIHNYNFCPNCGADMREVTDNEALSAE